ncbi:protein MIZU-KUSSEI 1 [Beta vulgaris subsp. vulgaris]|uniref:protein MIZU-KUSSEI 1 n=1 Tax=Beta vulgaris subsp. vulgaris TaxID=3555 RepID=UPI002036CE70|nr:protein MIZU-KUSSEI 1 [Beta vulgaris subsp. vulgaris]
MPSIHSIPFKKLQHPSSLISLLRNSNPNYDSKSKKSTSKTSSSSKGGLFKMFKLFPLLTSGCKVVALLAKSHHLRRPLISDHATIITLFGARRGKITLAIQENPHSIPMFVAELPILSSIFYKEMSCDILRVALESENKTHKKKVMEEFVWAVYCNGRKMGYSIRRKQMSDDELHVMHMLHGVSMGAGVLPPSPHNNNYHHGHAHHDHARDHHHGHAHDHHGHDHDDDDEKKEKDDGDQFTYLRARFERVVGSKDSEALYMINPDHSEGPELSIFFVRGSFN